MNVLLQSGIAVGSSRVVHTVSRGLVSGSGPGGEGAEAALRFGQVESRPDGPVVSWVLKRNCSISPRQLLWFYGSLCMFSLSIAGYFWSLGVWLVMPFAWLELSAVGLAFLVYARHAADRESLQLSRGELVVEQAHGARVERTTFRSDWVRVDASGESRGLIRLTGQGRNISIGRYIRPELRRQLAQELRMTLARAAWPDAAATQATASGRDGSV